MEKEAPACVAMGNAVSGGVRSYGGGAVEKERGKKRGADIEGLVTLCCDDAPGTYLSTSSPGPLPEPNGIGAVGKPWPLPISVPANGERVWGLEPQTETRSGKRAGVNSVAPIVRSSVVIHRALEIAVGPLRPVGRRTIRNRWGCWSGRSDLLHGRSWTLRDQLISPVLQQFDLLHDLLFYHWILGLRGLDPERVDLIPHALRRVPCLHIARQ